MKTVINKNFETITRFINLKNEINILNILYTDILYSKL